MSLNCITYIFLFERRLNILIEEHFICLFFNEKLSQMYEPNHANKIRNNLSAKMYNVWAIEITAAMLCNFISDDMVRWVKYARFWRLNYVRFNIHPIFICNFFLLILICTLPNIIYTQRFQFMFIVEWNQIWVVITLFRLIWYRTDYHLVSNQSLKCNPTVTAQPKCWRLSEQYMQNCVTGCFAGATFWRRGVNVVASF